MAFEWSFAYTNKVEDAKHQLARLKMQADNIDDYIAKFENLVRKVGIPRQEQGVLDKFKEGLKRGVHATILCRDQWPTDPEQAGRPESHHFPRTGEGTLASLLPPGTAGFTARALDGSKNLDGNPKLK